MIPKIEFKWSFIYQEEIHNFNGVDYNRDSAEKYILNFKKKVLKKWLTLEKKVLYFMANTTGLRWKEKKISCYLIKISSFGPISDPLTIPIQLKDKRGICTLNINRFIDMLIHELIHQLFIQNDLDYYFDKIVIKYKKYSENTAIHVPVHAIHKEIFLKFFNKKRLKKEIELCKYYPDYYKAWRIVEKEGSKKIINELKSFVQNK